MYDDVGDETEPSGRRGLLSRWGWAAVSVHRDDDAQAAKTIQTFLVVSILVNTVYTVFYLVSDPATLSHVLGVNATATVFFAFAILLARAGHQTAASLVGLLTAAVEILVCSDFLGWSVGFHLFLLAVGQLVFMVFTDRQGVFRWLFLAVATGVFIFCQFFTEYELGPSSFASHTRSLLFSLNAVGTGVIIYGLAAIAHLRGREAQAEARASTARAEYLANTDALTGLMNRRPIMLEFERMDSLESGSFCIAIADLDGFKALNDTFGHECGDRVLAAVGRFFRTNVRATDIVGRWGGEEFIFVLLDATLADSVMLMERLREQVADLTVTCGEHDHSTAASFGVADGEGGAPSFLVVKRADDAMYDAKAAGRNTVRSRPLAADDESAPTPIRPASNRSLRVRDPKK
ncbi:MAG: GGDEF domain-containing protein [Demequinaceae bacterium]|nr:GGDEF domain-containing protein [Demequinaceae bacterium]